MPPLNVLIYRGHQVRDAHGEISVKGPYSESVEIHQYMFDAVNEGEAPADRWSVKLLYGHEIADQLRAANLKKTVFVIPAGESTSLDNAFTDDQLALILDSVKKGMKMLCTCGSAYFASKIREWSCISAENPNRADLEPAYTTRKLSRLPLFNGRAVGPLTPYPGEQYNTAFFHEAIGIHTPDRASKVKILLSGGGTFIKDAPVPDDASPYYGQSDQVEVLAEYCREDLNSHDRDPDIWSPAIIKFPYAEGKVIFSMVNPGYGADCIDPETYKRAFPHRKDDWEGIRDSISSPDERIAFMRRIFNHFFS